MKIEFPMWCIVVLDRGFVYVGEIRNSETIPFAFDVEVSATIRVWGTTKGLAELKDGPLAETVIDSKCSRTTPFRSLIDIIHLTEKGVKSWKKKLEQDD